MVFRRHHILLVLLLIFLAPGIFAWYLFNHASWLGKTTTNYGDFVRPYLVISSLVQPLAQKKMVLGVQPKWHLILWEPKACQTACSNLQDKLLRIRVALGRKYYEVDEVLLLGEASLPESVKEGIDIISISSEEKAMLQKRFNKRQIFIGDAKGRLVLAYPAQVNSEFIYRDLKHLLNTTQV